MKKRNLVIGLLIMLSLLVTGFTFAYWASGVTGSNGTAVGTVQVGTGESITIDVVVGAQDGSTLVLVPKDRVVDSLKQAERIEINFAVTWKDDELLNGIADADISALIENIKVNNVANPYGLISVVQKAENPTTIALGANETFYFEITMDEPSTLEKYQAVAGLTITFDLTFTVTPK